MVLKYYETRMNFGDQLNPLIFNYFLPGFFDGSSERILLGIGTLLGMEDQAQDAREILVFSSGCGYADRVEIDSRYRIICLRGPLTARRLGADPRLAISDGALLLEKMNFTRAGKKYPYAFLPHHVSEDMFDRWPELADDAGVHYISPAGDPQTVMKEIMQTEVLFTEAMHGAIVADVFRVPWIPVKAYGHINLFKWKDWAMSVKLDMSHHRITSLLGDQAIRQIAGERFRRPWQKPLKEIYKNYQALRTSLNQRQLIRDLKKLKNQRPLLSSSRILTERADQLLEKIEYVKLYK